MTTTPFGGGYYYYFYDWKISKGAFECQSPVVPAEITIATSLDEESLNAQFELAPNPSEDFIYIQTKKGKVQPNQIMLSDLNGAIIDVLPRTTQNDRLVLDISSLASGVYFITIETEEGQAKKRFIKN